MPSSSGCRPGQRMASEVPKVAPAPPLAGSPCYSTFFVATARSLKPDAIRSRAWSRRRNRAARRSPAPDRGGRPGRAKENRACARPGGGEGRHPGRLHNRARTLRRRAMPRAATPRISYAERGPKSLPLLTAGLGPTTQRATAARTGQRRPRGADRRAQGARITKSGKRPESTPASWPRPRRSCAAGSGRSRPTMRRGSII